MKKCEGLSVIGLRLGVVGKRLGARPYLVGISGGWEKLACAYGFEAAFYIHDHVDIMVISAIIKPGGISIGNLCIDRFQPALLRIILGCVPTPEIKPQDKIRSDTKVFLQCPL